MIGKVCDFLFANECKFRLEDRVIFLPKIQISVTFDVRLMIVFLAKITHFSNRLIFVRVYNKASPKVNLSNKVLRWTIFMKSFPNNGPTIFLNSIVF